MNYSPLRYPGGKSKIAPLIQLCIKKTKETDITYIEPFAGGAGVALKLLLNGFVNEIVINDYDKAIYSFWRALKESPKEFIKRIEECPLTIDEWKRQKEIYTTKNNCYSVDLGFAAFYLNRTNRSGILTAGPIGGYGQKGNFFLDARFNRNSLIQRIEKIIKYKDKIKIYNKDIRSFISKIIPRYPESSFIYFDPPYYVNGRRLYKNALSSNDHYEIADKIINDITCQWVLTYDNVSILQHVYSDFPQRKYNLNYSAANKGIGSELIVFKSSDLIPSEAEINMFMPGFRLEEV